MPDRHDEDDREREQDDDDADEAEARRTARPLSLEPRAPARAFASIRELDRGRIDDRDVVVVARGLGHAAILVAPRHGEGY